MPFAHVRDADLFYDTVGTGPAVLFMHGNSLDHTVLRPWHDPLADAARLIYYDLRWHGRSSHRGAADHVTWHADAAALLDHLGEARATIFGHSYGSWLALGFAARYPERVERLILCGTSPAFDYTPEVIATAQARNPAAAEILVGGLTKGVASDDELRDVWHSILPLYFEGPPRPDIFANTQFSAQGFALAMQALDGFTMVDRLSSLDVPILILVGRTDYITPPSQAHRLASLAPRARVVELARSGHFPFVEQQDEYLAAFRDFLATG